ncbi:uncharacterized protein LOC125235245 [Leguminivora glycinivorella]|uniref:uncharacterized protein LOC125235245 n=1 Tax=Leguminivora glycinivorella TaxID=1035111 RepID=UPI00200EBB81|nr:uncharacterized protein LOC125235245 [Leguminivora glycinivorella]
MEEEQVNESMNRSEVKFDNLVILKEFSKIVNRVSDEEFLETVPKAKMKRVKWVPMFKYLKQGIQDEMIQEMNAMWDSENLPEKMEILQKQQAKYAHLDSNTTLWRPQLGDVKSQLKAHDVANLQKQKEVLEGLAKEYEARVSRLKKVLSAKRGYIKALKMDVAKYQKKNESTVSKITERLENHEQRIKIIIPTKPDLEINWADVGHDEEIENA